MAIGYGWECKIHDLTVVSPALSLVEAAVLKAQDKAVVVGAAEAVMAAAVAVAKLETEKDQIHIVLESGREVVGQQVLRNQSKGPLTIDPWRRHYAHVPEVAPSPMSHSLSLRPSYSRSDLGF